MTGRHLKGCYSSDSLLFKQRRGAKMRTLSRILPRLAAGILSISLIAPLHADWAPDPLFGLGEAGNFAVLSLGKPTAETDGQSKLDLSSAIVHGDVGVGPFGTLDFQGPSVINGNLYLDQTLLPQDVITDAGTVNGDRITTDLSTAVNDAIMGAQANADRPATQVFGRITTSMTLYSTGPMNVIEIDGIDFKRSSTTTPLSLTLMGGEDDLFVLNVSGKFVLGPNSSIRGVDPSKLLINVLPGNTPAQFAANSYVGGTLISIYRKMGPLQGASGPVIGASVSEISLVGGAVLNPPPQVPIAVIVADQTVTVGQVAQLDGSASTSAYGDPLTYSWTLLEKPVGSTAQLSNDAVVNPYFIADELGDYVVELVVCDGAQMSAPVTTTITASEPGEATDLAIEIDGDPDTVVSKNPVTYSITVSNETTVTATDAVMTATLGGDVRGTPSVVPTDLCSVAVPTVTCQLGDLEGYSETGITIVATPKRQGTFTVTATISSASEDPDTSNNTAVAETTVTK
jgi:hypothetical protein